MEFKHIEEKDLHTILSWFSQYKNWAAPPREALPDNGLGGVVIHKDGQLIVAGYLYKTNSKLALLEWVVANKEYREDDRDDAVLLLVRVLKEVAGVEGFKHIFAFTQHEKLIEKYEEAGFVKSPSLSNELVLKL